MAQSILELIFKTSKNGQGGKAAAAELKELKGTVGEVTSGMIGFNLGTLTAAGAVVAVAGAVSSAVTDYQAYVESVRGMAAITGTGVEQTSRLIQAFDDLGISQETVQTVMESAAKKGFVMSIDNVAKLADQYNRLSTQEEKNKLLTDKLGRSGLDLAKAFQQGGDAIRQAAANQEAGLIVTEKNYEDTEKLRKAQDDLNDSWTALRNNMAQGLIPGLSLVLRQLELNKQMLDNGRSAWEVEIFNQQLYKMTAEQADVAMKAMTADIASQGQELSTTADILRGNYNPAVDSTIQTQNLVKDAIFGVNTEMRYGVDHMRDAASAAQNFATNTANLQTATDNLKSAQQEWNQGAGADTKLALEQAGLKGEDYKKALEDIDLVYGTSFQQQEDYKDTVQALVDQYKKTGDLEGFRKGLENIKDEFRPMQEKIKDAEDEVDRFKAKLKDLTTQTWTINVQTNFSGNVPSALPGGGGTGGGSCFIGSTQIAIEDGSKPIKDIQVGELVWAYDEVSGERVLCPVIQVHYHPMREIWKLTTQTAEIFVTPEHRFYTGSRAWVAAEDLQPGDEILTFEGGYSSFIEIEPIHSREDVYNLSVQTHPNYFAAGHLAHNAKKEANAADFTVPAGYLNDNYMVGFSSGEKVQVVNDRERWTGNAQGSGSQVVIQQVVINNEMDIAAFVARLKYALPMAAR